MPNEAMSSDGGIPVQAWRRLQARREELLRRHARVEGDLGRRHEPRAADYDDQAIELQNDEALEQIGAAAEREIGAIDEALQRMQQGAYGICKRCGREIPARRLAAVPYATSCIACADD